LCVSAILTLSMWSLLTHSDLDIAYPGLMYNIISIYSIVQLYLTYILIFVPVEDVAYKLYF